MSTETTTPVADQVVVIPEANMWRVEEFFAKLVTRAKRTKKPAPCYIEVSRETKMVRARDIGIHSDQLVPSVFVTLQVAGNRPHIPGYTFIGTIQHTEGDWNVLSSAPGETMPEEYRQAKPVCDHCKMKRRRKDTFVMRNDETGQYKQIARNCLQDYLGDAVDVKDLVNQFTWWREALALFGECEEYSGFSGEARGEREDIIRYLQIVATMVRKFGWTSRIAAQKHEGLSSTASTAWWYMYPPMRPTASELADLAKVDIEDRDLEVAIKALEWIRALPEAQRVGYLGDVYGSCQSDTFRSKNDGRVASLVGSAYPRAMGEEKKRPEKAEKPVSQYVGEIGKRLKGLALKVKVMSYYENSYTGGYNTFLVLEDAAGNIMIWTASKDLEGQFDVGDVVTLDGTVKDHKLNSHEKYGDTKQTWLTRCTIKGVARQDENAA